MSLLLFGAIAGAVIAAVATAFIVFANGMRSIPGDFEGAAIIAAFWVVPAILLLCWLVFGGTPISL